MSTVSAERPGVFSRYTVIGSLGGGAAARAVGVIAASPTGEGQTLKHYTKLNDALAEYGDTRSSMLAALIKILMMNGISDIYAVSVGGEPVQEDYLAAFVLLDGVQGINGVVCDAPTLAIMQALAGQLRITSESGRERIGFFGIPADALPEQAAKALNCERVCLAFPAVSFEGGGVQSGAYLAAAYCAAALREEDPAANLNLAEVTGAFTFPAPCEEERLTGLLQAGVSAFEASGDKAELIRALTTKTGENGVQDSSLRELSTVRIIDDVIPGIRALLKAQLRGTKNTASARDAIRTQVACELSRKCSWGIIDSFEAPVVSVKENEPTVCVVELAFAVVYGLHRIDIVAHVSV